MPRLFLRFRRCPARAHRSLDILRIVVRAIRPDQSGRTSSRSTLRNIERERCAWSAVGSSNCQRRCAWSTVARTDSVCAMRRLLVGTPGETEEVTVELDEHGGTLLGRDPSV